MIPFITITLDKPYECKMSYASSVRYQQLTGKPIIGITKVTIDNLPDLLCAMLRQHIPDITVEKTVDMIDEYADSIPALIHLVAACLDAAYSLDESHPNVKTLATLNRVPKFPKLPKNT